MPKVQIEGVGIVQFDDAMSPDEIKSAIERDILPKRGKSPEDEKLAALGGTIREKLGALPGGQYIPDMSMGGAQALGAIAQMVTRAAAPANKFVADKLGIDPPQDVQAVEGANAKILDAYNRLFEPEKTTGSGIARGVMPGLAVGAITPAGGAATLARGVATGAGTGAVGGVLEPVYKPGDDFWMQKAKQAGIGAVTGGVVGAGGNVLGKVIGARASPQQQALLDENISMTPGQAAGGIFKGIEDRLAGFPIIGDIIKNRRMTGISDFNRAVYARALEGFGDEGAAVAKKADVGRNGIKEVGDFLSAKYQSVLPQTKVAIDDEFRVAMGELANMAKSMPPERGQQFVNILRDKLGSRFQQGGVMSGETMKEADSALGQLAATYKGSMDADQRLLGDALRQAQENLRDMVARQNPTLQPIVEAANQGWRTLVQMEHAGALVGARDGIFTPAQFLSAGVKRSDKSLRDRDFTRGMAHNQDLAEAAKDVLPSTVPDSGTAGRAALAYIMGEGAGTGLGVPGMMTLGSLAYAPGISPWLAKMLIQRPEVARQFGDMVKAGAPFAAAPAAFGASSLASQ